MRKKLDPGYQEQLEIQKYAENQRKNIQKFIESHQPRMMTLLEAKKWLKNPTSPGKMYGVIDPIVVASLDYYLVRQVMNIGETSDYQKKSLC